MVSEWRIWKCAIIYCWKCGTIKLFLIVKGDQECKKLNPILSSDFITDLTEFIKNRGAKKNLKKITPELSSLLEYSVIDNFIIWYPVQISFFRINADLVIRNKYC